MQATEIRLETLKSAVNAILDHLIEDLGLETVSIDPKEDFYWHCTFPDVHNSAKKPPELDVGRLSDDMDFVKLIKREQHGSVSYNLVHVAPLLRYIAEKIRR